MVFQDFPFPDHLPSYLHHTDVQTYIESYAKHFQLSQCVKLQTKVIEVSPIVTGNENSNNCNFIQWNIKYIDNGSYGCGVFDAVIVCNG